MKTTLGIGLLIIALVALLAQSPAPTSKMWSVTNTGAASAATASKAAGGGTVRHVATSITGCFSNASSGTTDQLQINLRDGATGAGTIVWSALTSTAVSDSHCVTLGNCGAALFIGSQNTAMTLEFAASGSSSGRASSVTLTGYDLSQ